MAITLADFNKIWASTSPLTPYSFSESNYKQGWNFIGSTPPARQMWDFLQKNNDEKMQYLANNYLPLSGGTLTGNLNINKSAPAIVLKDVNIERGTAPASNYSNIELTMIDKNGKRFWGLLHDYSTSGANKVSLIAYNGKTTDYTNGGISVGYDENGNLYTIAPTPAKERSDQNIATTAFVKTNLADYLPLSGGTMTGTISKRGDVTFGTTDNYYTRFNGGTSYSNGASLALSGKEQSGAEGSFVLQANDGVNSKQLRGKPDGALTWDGVGIGGTLLGGASVNVPATLTLPKAGTYLVITGHNSTAGSNGIWIVRTGGNNAFLMAGGSNIAMTCSGTTITVTSSNGNVDVYYIYLGG